MTVKWLVVRQTGEIDHTDLVQWQGLEEAVTVPRTVVDRDNHEQLSSPGNYFLDHSNLENVLTQHFGHNQALFPICRPSMYDTVGKDVSLNIYVHIRCLSREYWYLYHRGTFKSKVFMRNLY